MQSGDTILDADTAAFSSSACELLRQQGFALVRLPPADAQLAREHLQAAAAFFNDDRPDVYQADNAALAWQRSIDFLDSHLR